MLLTSPRFPSGYYYLTDCAFPGRSTDLRRLKQSSRFCWLAMLFIIIFLFTKVYVCAPCTLNCSPTGADWLSVHFAEKRFKWDCTALFHIKVNALVVPSGACLILDSFHKVFVAGVNYPGLCSNIFNEFSFYTPVVFLLPCPVCFCALIECSSLYCNLLNPQHCTKKPYGPGVSSPILYYYFIITPRISHMHTKNSLT